MSISLEALAVSFAYGDPRSLTRVPVLDTVSFCVEGPVILGLVGPNGVGKSTFLKIAAGLLEPQSGALRLPGSNGETFKSRVGYVPQSNPVLPWLKVVDDIGLPLKLRGMRRGSRRRAVEAFVSQFDFDLPLERRCAHLSGGQRQMVNLARALVGDPLPEVLLLDEPFASLDPSSVERMIQKMLQVFQAARPLVVLTTHQPPHAARVCHWVMPFRRRPVTTVPSDLMRIEPGPEARTETVIQETAARLWDKVASR